MAKAGRNLLNTYVADYVVFDLETTGISPKTDEVIEISAVKVEHGKVTDEFSTLVNPKRRIPYGASRVNGITDDMVAEAPFFEQVLEEFLEFIKGFVLVGHNIARFDMNFLYRDVEKYFERSLPNDYIDTLQMARRELPDLEHHRLTDLAEYYGISAEGAHRALNDCRMNQQVFEKMGNPVYKKQGTDKDADTENNRGVDPAKTDRNSQAQNATPAAVRKRSTFKLRAVVERITYQNPDNGYTVLKCAVKNYQDLVTVVGSLLDVNVGSVLLIDGNWKMDSRYGRQFQAETWEETMPATVFGIEKYLGSGLIKGVGPKYAKRIVQKFGTETIDVIETDVFRLREVEGIGEKRIRKIAESWEKQKEIKNVMLFLQDHGVSTSFAAKIYKQYGNESVNKVRENPFRLADDIWGIGFKTADAIAQKLGFEKEAFVRLRSGIMYTLSNLADQGHVYATKEQLIKTAAELLEAEEGCVVMTLDQMLADHDLILQKVEIPEGQRQHEMPAEREQPEWELAEPQITEAIYLPPFYYAETGVAGKLKRLLEAPAADRLWTALETAKQKTGNPDLSIDVEKIQEKVHMEYDEVQADAIRKAAVSKVMVPEGYLKNEENPLEGDVLIVDECSMIDIVLMNALLKAIPQGMRLILVGDIDQLPSVGAGNVLRDIIDSEVVTVIRLTRIFRQAQSSRIVMNAHRINEGKMPDISNGKDTDFFFVQKEDPQETADEVVRLVKNKLSRYYQTPPSQIQVLTPMQKGIVGATNLNTILQEALNPQDEGLRRGGFVFRVNDKVMQIRNNYDKEVFNGDIGMIDAVDVAARNLKVNFDGRIVEYDVTELDELTLAYATTIHKAQGSEYPIVVMPVLMNHFVMLQRNLIYTGITRAKKILVLVGTRKALAYAVRNVTVTKRNTLLKERLQEKVLMAAGRSMENIV